MQGFLSHFAEVIEGSLADKYGFCKQVYIIKIPPVLVLVKIWLRLTETIVCFLLWCYQAKYIMNAFKFSW